MKALTLTQPWATLVMLSDKRIETRSWSTVYRGPLAIHAAKGWKAADRAFAVNVLPMDLEFITRGAVLGTAVLTDCVPITGDFARLKLLAGDLEPRELEFGDYTHGRYAWLLGDVVTFARPVPARGMLGLWEWTPPPEPEGTSTP